MTIHARYTSRLLMLVCTTSFLGMMAACDSESNVSDTDMYSTDTLDLRVDDVEETETIESN